MQTRRVSGLLSSMRSSIRCVSSASGPTPDSVTARTLDTMNSALNQYDLVSSRVQFSRLKSKLSSMEESGLPNWSKFSKAVKQHARVDQSEIMKLTDQMHASLIFGAPAAPSQVHSFLEAAVQAQAIEPMEPALFAAFWEKLWAVVSSVPPSSPLHGDVVVLAAELAFYGGDLPHTLTALDQLSSASSMQAVRLVKLDFQLHVLARCEPTLAKELGRVSKRITALAKTADSRRLLKAGKTHALAAAVLALPLYSVEVTGYVDRAAVHSSSDPSFLRQRLQQNVKDAMLLRRLLRHRPQRVIAASVQRNTALRRQRYAPFLAGHFAQQQLQAEFCPLVTPSELKNAALRLKGEAPAPHLQATALLEGWLSALNLLPPAGQPVTPPSQAWSGRLLTSVVPFLRSGQENALLLLSPDKNGKPVSAQPSVESVLENGFVSPPSAVKMTLELQRQVAGSQEAVSSLVSFAGSCSDEEFYALDQSVARIGTCLAQLFFELAVDASHRQDRFYGGLDALKEEAAALREAWAAVEKARQDREKRMRGEWVDACAEGTCGHDHHHEHEHHQQGCGAQECCGGSCGSSPSSEEVPRETVVFSERMEERRATLAQYGVGSLEELFKRMLALKDAADAAKLDHATEVCSATLRAMTVCLKA